MAKILIIGCGDVGGWLAQQLVMAEHAVQGLRRSPFTLAGVTAVQGDVTQPGSLQFPAGLDYVYVLLAPGATGEEAYRRVYLEGTRNVLAALQGQQLRRVFWISSSSVYAQDDGEWVDETSAAAAAGAAGILLQSEALVRESDWPVTVVRFSGIYGPGRLRLLRWVQEGRPVQAEPVSWTNRIHSKDAAGLLAFLLEKERSGEKLDDLYLGTDNAPASQHKVLDWLADRLGLPHVPQEKKPGAGSNKRLSNRRITELGFRFRFPDFRAGYEDVLANLPPEQRTKS